MRDAIQRPEVIEHSFVVENECHGWRLDRFLRKKIPRLSRVRVQRVIRGDCEVDGRPCKPGQTVSPGQRITFRRPAPVEPEVPREVGVVAIDPDFYVLDKPAGIPMHPTAKYHYSTLTAVLRERFPGEALQITHRLDLETSGLVVIARTREAAVRLKQCFARRAVHKRYVALVHGELGLSEGDERFVDLPLGAAGGLVRVKMAVREGGLPSQTRVRVLRRFVGHTLVECAPVTGRQHQIRAHMDAIGHPLVGDKLYPDENLFAAYQDHGWEAVRGRLPLARQALHAAFLSFPHPSTGLRVAFESALPADIAGYIESELTPSGS